MFENGQLYAVRTDHIGRPVFATNASTGAVVWEASYLPFGGVNTSTGPNSDLRFPGQWFQSEAGLHQNWMRVRPSDLPKLPYGKHMETVWKAYGSGMACGSMNPALQGGGIRLGMAG